MLAYRVREGYFGDVTLADLKLVLVVTFEGNLWASQATGLKVGLFVDSRANLRQLRRLRIFGQRDKLRADRSKGT